MGRISYRAIGVPETRRKLCVRENGDPGRTRTPNLLIRSLSKGQRFQRPLDQNFRVGSSETSLWRSPQGLGNATALGSIKRCVGIDQVEAAVCSAPQRARPVLCWRSFWRGRVDEFPAGTTPRNRARTCCRLEIVSQMRYIIPVSWRTIHACPNIHASCPC